MRVIVTRVQPQAARWVKLLAPRFDAVALPLIDIQPLADTRALQVAGQRWADYAAVMFVSSAAVDHFFASNLALARIKRTQQAIKTRAWAPGPATRAALLAHGLAAEWVDSPAAEGGQFDSEALWQQVQTQIGPGARVLIVRGDTQTEDDPDGPAGSVSVQGVGRDWLAQRLRQAGAVVDFVVAYRRGAPVWGPHERSLATAAARDGSVWLFSSAEAINHLPSLLPGQSWAQARAVATHPRIAEAARCLGFGVVSESRPTLPEVLASIESVA
ncbi:uroporphyrinogen-III synthase [Rhodoferax sp.]|uniref:uroporphyrinogen-III synthase n=1 Tax=Rhodoferax sp. TaxID=50421 RepID=UPI00260EF3CC|nr:uroporphyrinogen-III synthase [Rhodoferax sp.]MDD2926891.1 uroporphyrinogen-III synthase [Rhodoferax sp.]